MNKVLITGANGQLGKELQKLLPDAFLTDVGTLDITNLDAVKSFVVNNHIETIINCAAYTAVDKAEDEPKTAAQINTLGPENLAKTGCRIVHISTDYVFDGYGYKPYAESDAANPLSVYGKTKLAGEKAVLDNAKTAIVIRTAWMYSAFGNNFVKTIRRLGNEKEQLNVVCDQIGTPTFAGDLALAIVAILPQMDDDNKGIYHYTNEGVCSWYDFAREIAELSGLGLQIIPIPSSAYPSKVQRPFYSVLDKTKIKETFKIEIPHWKDGLKKCLQQF